MHDPNESDGTAVAVALSLVMVLLLLGVGGIFFMWQRQRALAQESAMLRARAAAEVARARAIAEQPPDARAPGPMVSPHSADSDPAQSENATQAIEAAIETVMRSQQRAWNSGDIDQFMEFYWQSDDLTFSSAGQLTRTWQATLDNYKERYPSRNEMGELSFQNLEVTPLGTEAAFVLGEWRLTRESDPLSGNFTLVFRRLDDRWVIVHDHTSRSDPQ